MILIKINLKLIKKNPNAGKQTDKIFMGKTITFSGKGEVNEILKDGVNCFISEINQDVGGNNKTYSGVLFDESLVLELGLLHGLTINVKNNYQTINHYPEPKYFFKYINTTVECDYFGETFKSNEFLEIEEDESYSLTGCPFCKAMDCCEVVYETIEEALLRKKIK
jgi:hypothetical protein